MKTPSAAALACCPAATGFSLVEVLVALAVGILSTLAVLQLLSVSEGQKRTISGIADAEINGAFALYTLQRDIRQSGYGVASMQLLGCSIALRSGVTVTGLAPVVINHSAIPSGDAGTDTLLIVYGTGNGSTEGDLIMAENAGKKATLRGAYYSVMVPVTLALNDWIIATQSVRPTTCSWNLDRIQGNTGATSSAFVNGMLFNLGQDPRISVYAVRGGNLTVCNYMTNNCGDVNLATSPAVWVPIVNNIVGLRAQYGRDISLPMDGVVDAHASGNPCFDQLVESPSTSPSTPSRTCATARDPSVPSVQCGWARIPAVRIVVVARGGVRESEVVTVAAPTWAGTALAPIVLSANADWQRFRYLTFQTLIPLRNMILMGAQPGC